MYPTATRYPGPANANSLRQKPASCGTAIEPCTSRRLGAVGTLRQPVPAAVDAGTLLSIRANQLHAPHILTHQNLDCPLSKVKLHFTQMPSSTVENYLKAIYIGTNSLDPPQRLLPMGQLASPLNVTPGTAQTVVKTRAS